MKILIPNLLFAGLLCGCSVMGQDRVDGYTIPSVTRDIESVDIPLQEVSSTLGFSIRLTDFDHDVRIITLSLDKDFQSSRACRNQATMVVANENDDMVLHLRLSDIYTQLEDGDFSLLLSHEYRQLGYEGLMAIQELDDCKNEGMKWYRILLWDNAG